MDIETITKLIDAGYTKSEILAMSADSNDAGAENAGAENAGNAGAENADNAGEENAGKVEEIGERVDVNAAITKLTDTVANLTATVKAMQENNVQKAAGGKATDKIKDVMDSFIQTL